MRKLFCLLLAAMLTAGLFALTACSGNEAGIPDGTPADDAGTETEPEEGDTEMKTLITVGEGCDCASLEEAVACVKEMRENGMTEPVTVRMTAGDYFFENTVVIDESTPDLTIEADGDVRLIGGYRVTDFEPDTFNGADCLSAPVRSIDFADLYVNGERAAMTDKTLVMLGSENGNEELWGGSVWFTANKQLDKYTALDRARVTFSQRWIDEHAKIVSYDTETNRVTMDRRSRMSIGEGLTYTLQNVPELFKNADDWYAADGRVYYIPRDDSIAPDTIEAYIPLVSKLIDIRGTDEKPVTGVTLRGLTAIVSDSEYMCAEGGEFYASDAQSCCSMDGFISMTYASACSVENCRLAEYGLYGLVLDRGCREITVSGCDFYDGGSGGIKILGAVVEDVPQATDHITVRDCTILHCGRVYNQGCGILMIHTGNNVIEHNEIGDLYYSGISCGWVWGYTESPSHDNLITKNHIYNIGQKKLADMGGIYLLGPQPGTVVSCNVIHDITAIDSGWCLYADEGCSYVLFEDNVCYNARSNCFHQHYGKENTVRNNVFAFGTEQIARVTRDEEHVSVEYENNIFYTNGKPIHELWVTHLEMNTVHSKNNLIWNTKGSEIYAVDVRKDAPMTLEDAVSLYGLEEGSIVADPEFVDPDKYDFTLKDTSPAFAMGFKAIDTSDVGPRK